MKYLQKRIGSEVPVKEKKILKKKNPKVRVQNEAFYKKEIQEKSKSKFETKNLQKEEKIQVRTQNGATYSKVQSPGQVEEPKGRKTNPSRSSKRSPAKEKRNSKS